MAFSITIWASSESANAFNTWLNLEVLNKNDRKDGRGSTCVLISIGRTHLAMAANEWLKDLEPRNNRVWVKTSTFSGLNCESVSIKKRNKSFMQSIIMLVIYIFGSDPCWSLRRGWDIRAEGRQHRMACISIWLPAWVWPKSKLQALCLKEQCGNFKTLHIIIYLNILSFVYKTLTSSDLNLK